MLVSFLTISVDFLLFQIDGFHSDVIRLQSQKSEVLGIVICTRLKINTKEIFVQISSPEACFISKIQQFLNFRVFTERDTKIGMLSH